METVSVSLKERKKKDRFVFHAVGISFSDATLKVKLIGRSHCSKDRLDIHSIVLLLRFPRSRLSRKTLKIMKSFLPFFFFFNFVSFLNADLS